MDILIFDSEIADKPTHILEEMYYRDVGDWTDEARAIILKHLNNRTDRRVGKLVKYCPFCKEINNIKAQQCECGYDFDTSSETVALENLNKALRNKRILGIGMILIGGGTMYFRFESILEGLRATKGVSATHLLLFFLVITIGCGIYNLFTGPGKYKDPFNVFDQMLHGKEDEKE